MNSSKTQVNKKLKSLNSRINNISKRLTSNAPVAISSRNGNTGRDYYRTKGKERISNVTVLNKDFHTVDSFVNPANSSIFPWLSGIGKKYDLYHFKRLRFSYIPALPTSEEGNVYIGLDYNTLDPAPSSSTELCQLSHWTMNVVWKPSSISVDLNSIGWLYTRQGPVPNADYKTYDLGRIFFATEGISFTGTVGYVEVEYDVEFKRRQPDYVTEVSPSVDTYTPIASVNTGLIPATSYTPSIDVSSYSNNPIIVLDYQNGYIRVSKPVRVLLSSVLNTYDFSAPSTNVMGVSTDNSSYSLIENSKVNDTLLLEPGNYYKLYNYSSSQTRFRAILTVVDN